MIPKDFDSFIASQRQEIPDAGFSRRVLDEVRRSERSCIPRSVAIIILLVAVVVLIVTVLIFALQLSELSLIPLRMLLTVNHIIPVVLILTLLVSSASLIIFRATE